MRRSPAKAPQPVELVAEQNVADDRRSTERHVTTFRTGRLTRDLGDELCLIRNISPGGAMLHVSEPYTVGETVKLDLRLNEQLPACVAWVRDYTIGLTFDAPVDLNVIFVSHARDGARARAPRLTVPASGRLQIGDDMFHIVTVDVSQGGAKLFVAKPLRPGATGRLWLDGFCSRMCTIRWCGDGVAGVAFDQGISVSDLSVWAKHMRHAFLDRLTRAGHHHT